MSQAPKKEFSEKNSLHPRNQHRARYDFQALIKQLPELATVVFKNEYGDESIDFADPVAVKYLNKALLKTYYGIEHWDIPEQYLCPPIPGRADYIHYAADLLASSNAGEVPEGYGVRVLDIGVGANCVYPIIGTYTYGWRFVGAEVDEVSFYSAQKIAESNPLLEDAVECRLQHFPTTIFRGIIRPFELFDLTICNPPFHASAQEAEAATTRKWNNLGNKKTGKPTLNFGGQHNELWCEGGEQAFIWRMVEQSVEMKTQCLWFTTLVSKKESLPAIYNVLKKVNATEVQTIDMSQGQKNSRMVAWTFMDKAQHKAWALKRWSAKS